ncbi:hypothetical protein H310_13022 [Aphanomyces invadans]|uniref:Uncharacterized protein n=1 Tax=Aphanomyces invadans TaxID=157072 RepID=A0A024TFL9_9STRA|nr:hypothetical protein H310_13022 [Aphanomyces invadans]ETV92809.1 hypothetical protein H310_13022 [Aphanomyces invadans]|eukprot:XP_008878579.1 hypothetical protein H310_13022 [Aphanomyces invadans]
MLIGFKTATADAFCHGFVTIGVYAIQWTLTTAENKSIASSAYAATTVVYTFVLATSGGVVGTITTLVGAASTTITADLDLTKANFTALKEIDETCSNENVTGFTQRKE